MSPTQLSGVRRPRRRRGWLAMVMIGTALAGVVTVAALAGAATAPRAAAPAASCPTTGGTPLSTTLTNGTVKIGPSAQASGTSATGCGLLRTDFTTLIPKADLSFAPFALTVLILSVPARLTPASDFTGPVSLVGNTIHTTLTGSVTSTASVLGFTCTIGPFSPSLTTDTSGALTGSPFVGQPDGTLKGRLVANNFTVPAVTPSRTCPGIIAGLVSLITRLPQPAGGSSITFDATIKLG